MLHSGVHKTGKITASRGVTASALAVGLALACAPVAAHAQSTMTPAATWIDNVASMTVQSGDQVTTLASNHVALQVQEILDVRVDVLTPEVDVEADSQNQRLGFRIFNLGNGWEAFDLSVQDLSGDFDPQSCQIWVDWDGDGHLDTTRDRASTITPVLAPGASVVAWVSCSIPATAKTGALGRILLRAYPAVLRGGATPGVMATAGNSGVYAVMGPNLRGGTGNGGAGDGGASQPASFRVGKVNAQLIKTQAVQDPAGGARAVPGAIVTYTLEARFGVGLAVRQAAISDPIPAGSAYVPGSLTLDGAALSDAADADTGRFTGDAIEVGLGDVAAPTTRVVTFKVRINPLGSPS